jgi:predicted dehydrogenase
MIEAAPEIARVGGKEGRLAAVGIGIIGLGYGLGVQLPAFRHDSRVEVRALCARDEKKVQEAAKASQVPQSFTDWQRLIHAVDIDAVVISVPPLVQAEIAAEALTAGKAVFAEKPLAADLAGAKRVAELAATTDRPNVIGFTFTRVPAFEETHRLLSARAIGALRHVAVSWNVENYANRHRLQNWKSSSESGGGALFNFVAHCLHYLEWLVEPIAGLSARLDRMPGDTRSGDTFVAMAFRFRSGVAGSLSMSAAAFPGSGHRIEIYGEDGALTLDNPTTDYMRGFSLRLATRNQPAWRTCDLEKPVDDDSRDGRILPASRLARSFIDWLVSGVPARPNFADGLRVQLLLDAARRANDTGCWQSVPHE